MDEQRRAETQAADEAAVIAYGERVAVLIEIQRLDLLSLLIAHVYVRSPVLAENLIAIAESRQGPHDHGGRG